MSYWLLVPTLYLASTLDVAVMPRWAWAGAMPQLVLLAGFAWIGVFRGRKSLAGAALAGLVADLSQPGRFGVCFGLLSGASLLADVLGGWWPRHRLLAQIALVALGTAAGVLLVSLLGPVPAADEMDWPALVRWSAVTGMYTAALAWPFLATLHARQRAPR